MTARKSDSFKDTTTRIQEVQASFPISALVTSTIFSHRCYIHIYVSLIATAFDVRKNWLWVLSNSPMILVG